MNMSKVNRLTHCHIRPVIAFAAILTLAACGGGGGTSVAGGVGGNPGGGGGGGGQPPVVIPPAFANGTDVVGVQAVNSGDPTATTLLSIDGSVDGTGRLILNDGTYNLITATAFESGVAVEEGNASGLLTQIALPNTSDMVLYDGFYIPGTGARAVYYGIVGPALSDTLSTSGTSSWSGQGFANLISNTGTEDLGLGTVSVTASFADAGDVDATITGLSGSADEIRLSDMMISGGQFSGGQITLLMNNSVVSPLGAVSSATTSGFFSGVVTDGLPDEVGGVFTAIGGTGTLVGGFVAD